MYIYINIYIYILTYILVYVCVCGCCAIRIATFVSRNLCPHMRPVSLATCARCVSLFVLAVLVLLY